uniref:Uncharacterized protein n=1 Tax=Tetraselmis chuii TaxID=63592 RepID=A0A7S1SNN5_9CHLO|mmetsp:Transcript_20348/g.36306  ORF Transcript_20348/g.36306 Transcript_20348/m.36306 type:complete len:178 (+) Transcript_20348:148-681(+)
MAAATMSLRASLSTGRPVSRGGAPASLAAPVTAPALRFAAPATQRSQSVRAARPGIVYAATASADSPSYVSTSTKYAIVEVAGQQIIVEEGRWYSCNRLEAAPGSKIQLGRVLAARNEGDFMVGQPYLENVTVEAEVMEELKGPKILVYKMKPKKHYRRMAGHRQSLSKFKVTKISV